MNTAELGAPAPLAGGHDTSEFTCRHESLSAWLGKRALANAVSGASRTYVVCAAEQRVIGYYALAAGSIAVRALLCHAIDEEAKAFYLKHGFVESPRDPLTMMLGLREAR